MANSFNERPKVPEMQLFRNQDIHGKWNSVPIPTYNMVIGAAETETTLV